MFSEKLYKQKQPSRGVLRKRCSENIQQNYRIAPMPKWDFNKKLQSNFIEISVRHGRSPVNLLHIFRTTFPENISGRLLMYKTFKEFISSNAASRDLPAQS